MGIWAVDLDLDVQATWTKDCRVDQILSIRSPDHDDVLQALNTIDFREQLRDDRGLHVTGDSRTANTEHRVHLVEEDDHGPTFEAFLPRTLEDETNMAFGLSDVLVQQLGPLHVDEVALRLVGTSASPHLLCEAVRNCFGNQRFSASRGPVQQDAFGCG